MKRISAAEVNVSFLAHKIIKVDFIDIGVDAWRWIFRLEDGSIIMLPVYPLCPVDLGNVSDPEYQQLVDSLPALLAIRKFQLETQIAEAEKQLDSLR